ncbi:ATP-dependent DNA ligase [Solihabitans fulvus]|uniref:DNA ligase (ATP) n=1 Tax=Solihabitans fulvus TaxID=1892852 RepID=A0A5B2XDA4_9PSEU|nr:ATP-dependent DNA ligase [Solihabitans fulvus]KAA2261154.1 ATP-dependent DNA ligase [Solihabitans fulvus]
MALPLTPPVQPMLANSVDRIPADKDLVFEPKWDGFRCLVFRDGDEVVLQSRSGKPLNRYFPEVVETMRAALPDRVVLDGELVVAKAGRLDFDTLSDRIHPAASRVALLAEQTPASYVAFDLLATGDRALLGEPAVARRAALLDLLTGVEDVRITPATTDVDLAMEWFELFEGAGLDGVMGKPANGVYTPGKRTMIKVKHARTADCVVAGLRWHLNTEPGTTVGSLLLGLHDDAGVLHHVGVVGSFPTARRRALATELAPLIEQDPEDHPWLGEHAQDGRRLPGSVNRWRAGEQPWVPLRCERVVEVAYTQTEGQAPARFRHNPQFGRWRPDREPESCRYDQLDQPARYDLAAVLRGEVRPAT